jgi:hypothetical protein
MDKLSLVICALCACAVFTACAGSNTLTAGDTAQLAPPALVQSDGGLSQSALPSLPLFDLPEARTAAASSTRTLSADDFSDHSGGAALVGDALVFTNSATPAWAVYKFGGLYADDLPRMLSFELENDPSWLPQHLYIGVSNYATQHWDWYDAHYPAASFSLGIPTAAIPQPSPNGNVYVCVLCMNDRAMLRSLSLSFDYVAPPPVDLRAGDGTSRVGIELNWADPEVTYEGGPHFDYDGIAIERAISQAGPWDAIATVPPGITSYMDTDAAGLNPGTRAYYRLHLVNDGKPGHPGVPDQGYVNFAPVVLPITGQIQEFPAPYTADLSVIGSYDPDGGALRYQWQFDDGEWQSTEILPAVQHTFMHNTDVHVRATDDEGTSTTHYYRQITSGSALGLTPKYSNGDVGLLHYGLTDAQHGTLLAISNNQTVDGLCKLDSDLQPVWVRGWPMLRPIGFCSDGSFYGWYDYGNYQKVGRFSADGDLEWAKNITFTGPPYWELDSCWVDPLDNLWLLGYGDYSGEGRILICEIDSSAGIILAKVLGSVDQPGWAIGSALAFDDAGNTFVRAGTVSGEKRKSYIVKLDPAGNLVWQKHTENSDGTDFSYWGGFTRAGDDYVCVADDDSSGYLFAVDGDGNVQWARRTVDRFLTGNYVDSLSSDGTNIYLHSYSTLELVSLSNLFSLDTWTINASGPWSLGQYDLRKTLFSISGLHHEDGSPTYGNWTFSSTDLQDWNVLTVDTSDFSASDADVTLSNLDLVEETNLPEIVEDPEQKILIRFLYPYAPYN